jgi:hypothetical protein
MSVCLAALTPARLDLSPSILFFCLLFKPAGLAQICPGNLVSISAALAALGVAGYSQNFLLSYAANVSSTLSPS